MKVSTISLLKCFAIVALVGVSVFSAPQKTLASSMNGYFSETNASGDFTTQQTLKLEYDPAGGVSENQVVFTVRIKPTDITTPGDIPQADPTTKKLLTFHFDGGTNENSAEPHGTIDTEANLGYWDSIFGNTLDSGNGTTGIYLDLKKKDDISPYCLTTGFYTSGCFSDSAVHTPYPLIHYLLKNDGSNKMRMLGTDITFNIQMNDLSPDTYYQARIRIEEDGSTDVGSSALVTFRTKPAGSGSLSGTQETHEAGGQAIIDETTNLPSCGVFGESSSIMGCVAQIVYYVIFQPTAYVMTLAGEIMDWGIGYSIDSNSYPTTGDTFVTKGWRIMRDLSNMLFIFVLLYIAIATILDLSGVNTGKMIGTVIIVALLINFSLFFVKIIVDAGNIMTRLFYNQVSVKNSGTGAEITGTAGYKSISYGFAAKFNPTSLFSIVQKSADGGSVGGVTAGNATLSSALTPSQFAGFYALFSFIGAIVNLVAAFVFFSLAWLFVGRVIAIWLMMIFAPLVFIFYTLPKGATSAIPSMLNPNKYWTDLIKQSFMPVMAMLMIFLILSFLNTNIVQGIAGATTTTGKFMAVLVPLMLITMLLLATKKTATEMSGMVAEYAGKVGSFVGGAAVGIATGGAAMALRGTVGRAGSALSNNEKLREMETQGGIKGAFARSTLSMSRGAATSSFDARNTKAGEAAAKQTGFDFNKNILVPTKQTGKERGWEKVRKDQIDKDDKRRASVSIKEDSSLGATLTARNIERTETLNKIKDDLKKEKSKLNPAEEELKKAEEEFKKLEGVAGFAASKERTEKQKDIDEKKKALNDQKDLVSRLKEAEATTQKEVDDTDLKKLNAKRGKEFGKNVLDKETVKGVEASVVGGALTGAALAGPAGIIPGAVVGFGKGALNILGYSPSAKRVAVNNALKNKVKKSKAEEALDKVKEIYAEEEKEKGGGGGSSGGGESKEGGGGESKGPTASTSATPTGTAGPTPGDTQQKQPMASAGQGVVFKEIRQHGDKTQGPTGNNGGQMSSIFTQNSGGPKILNIQMPSAGQINIKGINTKTANTEQPERGNSYRGTRIGLKPNEEDKEQANRPNRPVVEGFANRPQPEQMNNQKLSDASNKAAEVASTVGKPNEQQATGFLGALQRQQSEQSTTKAQPITPPQVDTPPAPPAEDKEVNTTNQIGFFNNQRKDGGA